MPFAVLIVCGGSESEVGDYLEAITDPDHQFVFLSEFKDVVAEVVVDFVCKSVAGSGVVAIGKSSWYSENLIVTELFVASNEIVDVDNFCLGSRPIETLCGFFFAIYAVAGDDENFRSHLIVFKG